MTHIVQRDDETERQRQRLIRMLEEGIASLKAGRVVDADAVERRIRAIFDDPASATARKARAAK